MKKGSLFRNPVPLFNKFFLRLHTKEPRSLVQLVSSPRELKEGKTFIGWHKRRKRGICALGAAEKRGTAQEEKE